MKMKKLTPDMMVDDVQKSVEFYVNILGFKLDMAVPENSKSIENELKEGKNYAYAMVCKDEVYIMFMRRDVFEVDLPILKDVRIGASVSFYCDVEDIDKVYNSLKDRVDIINPSLTDK